MKDEINWMINDAKEVILSKPKHKILIAFTIASSIGAILIIANIIIFMGLTISLYTYWYLEAYNTCKKNKPEDKTFNPPA